MGKLKEISEWRARRSRAMYPKYNPPSIPERPVFSRNFILEFAEFMNVKSKLKLYGYEKYWSEWGYKSLYESGFVIIMDEISRGE